MIKAASYARENRIPYLGLCLGMQIMVIEYARYALKTREANSTEFDLETLHPVIDIMPDQRDISGMGGTMRLGVYPCDPVPETIAGSAYRSERVMERHRHRFEFNNDYRKRLEEAGLIVSGLSPDGTLVEISEVQGHPFMVGTQFHAEFNSRPNRPHPLFCGFVDVAKKIIREGGQHRLPIE